MYRYQKLFETLLDIQESDVCILSEEEMRALMRHRDCIIRSELCYSLLSYRPEFARQCLLHLIYDPNHLVRSSAAECLDMFVNDQEVCEALLEVYRSDKNTLVRGYAAYSLLSVGRTQEEVVAFVETSLSKEHYYFVRLLCYYGLYRFCKRAYLPQIIDCFSAQKYITRVATANVLLELLEDHLIPLSDFEMVQAAIQKITSEDPLPDMCEKVEKIKRLLSS